MTRRVILAEFTPWDPVAAAAVTVRACNIDDQRATTLDGIAWTPAISAAPKRTLDLFDGEFGGKISAGIGDIEIALAAFPNAARYAWGERPVKLWRGVLGDGFGAYTLIFEGLTRPPRASNGRMRIGLRVDDRWLDRPLLATYAGSGGVEGPADLKGVAKPLALGAPQFVEGVTINRTLNIVQLHGYGAINGVPTALSRLSRYSASAGNDANYAALAAATIAPGAWRTCLAEGLVRLGAPPGGVLSVLMQGDSGSGLGWVRTPGQVIRRIATIAGASAGQIDTASLASLDAAVPFNISLFLRDQVTARDVIQSIAASCNAAAGVSWLGKLFVARAAIGAPALTLAADGSALPPVASVEMLESSAPFWRLALEAERTERVHAAGEFEAAPVSWGALINDGGKPEDNATAADNLVSNAGLVTDAAQWLLSAGVNRQAGSAGEPAPALFLFQPGFTETSAQFNLNQTRPLPSTGRPLFVRVWSLRGAGTTGRLDLEIYWKRADGSDATPAITATSIRPTVDGLNTLNEFMLTPPAGAASFSGRIISQADVSFYAASGLRIGVTQAAADVTGQNTAADTAMVAGTPAATVLGDISTAQATANAALTAGSLAVPPKVITGLGASAALDVVVPAGESRNFQAVVYFDLVSGTRTLTAPMEARIGSGGWSGFGTANSDTDAGPSTLFIQNTGTITNSGSTPLNFQVRAVVAITGSTGGTVTADSSFIGLF